MILLAGNSGSGKTTVASELENMGYTIVPTYTTRVPRPEDKGTICISETQFEYMQSHNKFMSCHMFNSKMGPVAYGIPIEEYEQVLEKGVIIVSLEYYEGICRYVSRYTMDFPFLVYLDVDDLSIMENSLNDANREFSRNDLISRLERDREKNHHLKSISSLVIHNTGFRLSPSEIASIIRDQYNKIGGDSI